ncbi:MAG: DUF5060 domain-containing protein [Sedimentisphaerales bacterium]|nr:DUF5060 domain-containing protein [Sedimentisphaerales bacterium]
MRRITVRLYAFDWCLSILLCAGTCQAAGAVGLRVSAGQVGRFERVDFAIAADGQHDNPYDPNQISVDIEIKTPGGEIVRLPAFYSQDYEHRQFRQSGRSAAWFYPVDTGSWKARFAPMETGAYEATAAVRAGGNQSRSQSVTFECVPSQGKGFLRVGRADPRFFELSDGTPFFAIGQNLAFVGEGQYVTLVKADEIFGKLGANGANFVRVWTCCSDWALAIEAPKSAWDRSWRRRDIIVPLPGAENGARCVKIEGDDGTSITASPSHPVALRPETRYVLRGRFRTDGPTALRIQRQGNPLRTHLEAAAGGQWQSFHEEFTTGRNDYWLGTIVLAQVGVGTIWLDGLSLKEAAGGPELLWEADVNRPIRGAYNQLDCFMLDKLLESAEAHGIRLMLCLITRDLYMKDLSSADSPQYGRAIEDAKKLLRYAVARWGYSTSVGIWEYFNEIDPGLPTERFYAELATYLEQIDPYHHLRATSTWSPSAKDCRLDSLDVAQLHHYMRLDTQEDYKDEQAVIAAKAQFLRAHAPAKPVLIGEFGLATPQWRQSDYLKQDTEGIHFHNCLWASAFSGGSGTAMFWWWEELDRQNAYRHYRPLSAFLRDISLARLDAAQATALGNSLGVLGYQGRERAYLWLFDPQAIWWNQVAESRRPAVVKNALVEIEKLQPGPYRVLWWDTARGEALAQQSVTCGPAALRLAVPPFTGDIACKIERP